MSGTIPKIPLSLLLISLLSLSTASSLVKRIGSGLNDDEICVYTLYIRTGSIWKGGTDANISVALAGSDGYAVQIKDIVEWGGLMGSNYDYFERGNLDIFSGRGPCISSPLCWMNLTSDGTGSQHGWYCNYVEVTATGPHMDCSHQIFTIEQWLATDAPPYQLYVVRDKCPAPESGSMHLSCRMMGSKGHMDA